ncbi:MAG: dihydrofolate reductase family protein [Myxococcales bacterium]|nr:dihydrofolate reductase family protein [Myxococcales bacterium]
MRELAILTFATVDGIVQAPGRPDEDRSGGFERGGWAVECWDEVMEQVRREAMAAPYDLLFGRKTYDLFAGSFSSDSQNPMNSATKHVVTSSASTLQWENSRAIEGDIPSEVSKLKREAGPLLQVHGSAQLVRPLLAHGLVDLFRLWTFPVLVGSGKRIFDGSAAASGLTLIKSEPTRNGAVMSLYRRRD